MNMSLLGIIGGLLFCLNGISASAENIQSLVKCVEAGTGLKVEIVSTVNKKPFTYDFPMSDLSSEYKFKSLKGCAAVEKNLKVKIQDLKSSAIEKLNSVLVVQMSLPMNENGNEFEVAFESLIFEIKTNSLVIGPNFVTSGLENVSEIEYLKIAPQKIEVKVTTKAEGNTLIEYFRSTYEKGSWTTKVIPAPKKKNR